MSLKHCNLWILCFLLLLLQGLQSRSWFFSSKSAHFSEKPSEVLEIPDGVLAHFSMEVLGNKKGVELVEKAKEKAAISNSCWQNAYLNLFAACSEILAAEQTRSRLAWHLSDCFQKDTGRLPFPHCHVKSSMVDCLKQLDADAHGVYLAFYLEVNSICHQLQADAFKRQTEILVNELKKSAENAENKLDIMEEKSDLLLQSSYQIHGSLASIDIQTQQVARTSKDIENHVNVVLEHSQMVYEQATKIAASQSELQEGQEIMKGKLEEGMTMLNESASKLGDEIMNLRDEAIQIEKEIGKVGDAISVRMDILQCKADDIENIAEISLDKQKQLLDSQTSALNILEAVTKFQSQALEESRHTLQQLVEHGHSQQQELLQRQEELKEAHDHLVENSKTILAAQETFESKQASMFIAIDKLFTLHNAILLESRVIKAFIVYSILIFILYIFTSTKETYGVRSRLYIGLCLTFLIEFVILKYTTDIEQQTWIISLIRSLFVLLASAQLLYAIYTYRDYETLNHQMLLSLIDKVNGMQRPKEFLEDMDSEVEWSSWVDTDLPEDVDILEDPDYMLPETVVVEDSSFTSGSRKYSLRNRDGC